MVVKAAGLCAGELRSGGGMATGNWRGSHREGRIVEWPSVEVAAVAAGEGRGAH